MFSCSDTQCTTPKGWRQERVWRCRRHFADILPTFCRHFADILPTFCRRFADILLTFCWHYCSRFLFVLYFVRCDKVTVSPNQITSINYDDDDIDGHGMMKISTKNLMMTTTTNVGVAPRTYIPLVPSVFYFNLVRLTLDKKEHFIRRWRACNNGQVS